MRYRENLRCKKRKEQTIDKVGGRRPATLGGDGGDGIGGGGVGGGDGGQRLVVLFSKVVDQVVETVWRRWDPVR
jgi:hypothetical protein